MSLFELNFIEIQNKFCVHRKNSENGFYDLMLESFILYQEGNWLICTIFVFCLSLTRQRRGFRLVLHVLSYKQNTAS